MSTLLFSYENLQGFLLLLSIWNKLLFLAVVMASTFLFLWLAVSALKANLVLKFEEGMSRHYLLLGHELDNKEEILHFGFRHLDIGQVLFLIVCWIIRKADPKMSLYNLRFPAVIRDTNVHVGKITSSGGRVAFGQLNVNNEVGNRLP